MRLLSSEITCEIVSLRLIAFYVLSSCLLLVLTSVVTCPMFRGQVPQCVLEKI